MKHTRNSVDLGRRQSRLTDSIEDFAALGRDTLGGVRSAAGRVLRQIHDIDLSPQIKEAVLYGPTNKPVKTGDFAQLQTVGIERRLKRQQPHIFIGDLKLTFVAADNVVFYRPEQPEQLHRVYLSTSAIISVAFARELKLTGAFVPPKFWGQLLPGLNLSNPIEFGEIGVLLTPTNPLTVSVSGAATIILSLQLSTAQLG